MSVFRSHSKEKIRTVDIEFVQFRPDCFAVVLALQELRADDVDQPGVCEVECGRKVCDVQFSGLAVGLVQYVFVSKAECGSVACLGKVSKVFFSGVGEIQATVGFLSY